MKLTSLDKVKKLKINIQEWIEWHHQDLTYVTICYIQTKMTKALDDSFGYFCLLVKLHKIPTSMYPVCSDCRSLLHSLGKWADLQLQPFVQQYATYFKNSLALKEQLDLIILQNNASIFTYDAISMYMSINREDGIHCISNFLWGPVMEAQFPHYKTAACINYQGNVYCYEKYLHVNWRHM